MRKEQNDMNTESSIRTSTTVMHTGFKRSRPTDRTILGSPGGVAATSTGEEDKLQDGVFQQAIVSGPQAVIMLAQKAYNNSWPDEAQTAPILHLNVDTNPIVHAWRSELEKLLNMDLAFSPSLVSKRKEILTSILDSIKGALDYQSDFSRLAPFAGDRSQKIRRWEAPSALADALCEFVMAFGGGVCSLRRVSLLLSLTQQFMHVCRESQTHAFDLLQSARQQYEVATRAQKRAEKELRGYAITVGDSLSDIVAFFLDIPQSGDAVALQLYRQRQNHATEAARHADSMRKHEVEHVFYARLHAVLRGVEALLHDWRHNVSRHMRIHTVQAMVGVDVRLAEYLAQFCGDMRQAVEACDVALHRAQTVRMHVADAFDNGVVDDSPVLSRAYDNAQFAAEQLLQAAQARVNQQKEQIQNVAEFVALFSKEIRQLFCIRMARVSSCIAGGKSIVLEDGLLHSLLSTAMGQASSQTVLSSADASLTSDLPDVSLGWLEEIRQAGLHLALTNELCRVHPLPFPVTGTEHMQGILKNAMQMLGSATASSGEGFPTNLLPDAFFASIVGDHSPFSTMSMPKVSIHTLESSAAGILDAPATPSDEDVGTGDSSSNTSAEGEDDDDDDDDASSDSSSACRIM